ncbi:MAG: rhomboid family intramembrane serine protease [Gemmataceae bacterium]
MGIYDREYYRDENSSFLGSIVGRGRVVNGLIIVNVVVLLVQIATRDSPSRGGMGWFTDLFDLNPDAVLHGQVWRLLTSAFLHSFAWPHIVFNMLFLWWFGNEVEDIYGPREFLAFYLAAALVSSIAYVFVQWAVGSPNPALGASGAVTATLVLFAMHFPTRTILVMWVIPMPVIALVCINVLQDTLGLLGGSARPIAFAAHLGGAAFGFLYYRFQWRVMNILPNLSNLRLPKRRPRLKVYRGEAESHNPRPSSSVADEHLEAELDAVLAKVARQGKSSLTEREHTILMRASEIYRNRRK